MIDCVYINLPDSKSLHKDLHSRCHKARSIIKDIKRKTKSVRQHLTIPIPSTKKNAKTVFFVALFCKYWVNQKWRPKSPEARDMCFSLFFSTMPRSACMHLWWLPRRASPFRICFQASPTILLDLWWSFKQPCITRDKRMYSYWKILEKTHHSQICMSNPHSRSMLYATLVST